MTKISEKGVTIYKSLKNVGEPNIISVDKALTRIGSGASKTLVELVRIGKGDKRELPCVSFSGSFSKRNDNALLEHSGLVCLDFDKINTDMRRVELEMNDYVMACWLSPSGTGLKALIRVADSSKHKDHYASLLEEFPDADRQTSDISRLCFESYDPDIFINYESKIYDKIKTIEKVEVLENISDESVKFNNITNWLTKRGDAFATGERNIFIFKLASACCRFGIGEEACRELCVRNFEIGTSTFSNTECNRTVQSAYKSNAQLFDTARFEKGELIDQVTRQRVETKIDPDVFDETVKPKDVIFGEDVRDDAMNIFDNGYESLKGIGVEQVDKHFKFKQGEITLISGIGNYGKSTYWGWVLLMRCIKYGDKFAIFSPEENPAQEFYFNLTEMLLGANCAYNMDLPAEVMMGRPDRKIFERAYDWISEHIFFVFPETIAPTPEYIKERFLELIIKKRVNGVLIDPFNQLSNNYTSTGGRSDKYLETFLSDCKRFAQTNNVFFNIIAHPIKMTKQADGNYPCPDVFDIADGAMWNNKMDNILIYHRPVHQTDPTDPVCEFHSKKIRRQKTVGAKGYYEFEYSRKKRRFLFAGVDHMEAAIEAAGLNFYVKKSFAERYIQPIENDLIPF